jgi:ATP-binding cassette, subfamily B (MDR/TAP), member 1
MMCQFANISQFCFRIVGLRISAAMRMSYMHSLFRQSVAKLDEVSPGTVSNTITSSAGTIQLSISDRLAYLFQGLALIIAAYAVSFRYSWQMTLIASAQLVFLVLIYSFTTPATLKAQKRVDQSDEKHATVASEIFSSIRTVFALGAERPLADRYGNLVDESGAWSRRTAPYLGIQIAPVFFATFSTYSLTFWAGLTLYHDGVINNVSQVIIAFFSILIIVSVMGQILQPIMNITKAISASTTFFEMIDSEPPPAGGKRGPEVSASKDIEFFNVNFAYPTRSNVPVLQNLSLVFKQGETTAIVGPSGSGKSTIVGLLERWYTLESPTSSTGASGEESSDQDRAEKHENMAQISGSIRCGDVEIGDIDLKWWRTQVGLVQQEPFLFNDTIFKNVAYGLLGTEWEGHSDNEKIKLVQEACREAFADEFIEKLPEGYMSKVGESGVKLSGGQRQRLAIARSIVRQPAILILDEATSAIDVRSEAIVQKALDRISKSRTTIVIAHRLATIRKADHIIVLRNGSKIEQGTHDKLLEDKDGLYYGLVRAQQLQAAQVEDESDISVTSESADLKRQATYSSTAHAPDAAGPELAYKKKGFFRAVGGLVYAQRNNTIYLIIILVCTMGAGASYALQSWFFSQLVNVFTFVGERLENARDHWSLMFFILALANAVFYFAMSYASAIVSASTVKSARKDYFSGTINQNIPYFDKEDNASGAIMSRLSSDPKTLGEIMGLTGVFPLTSIWTVVSCITIAFYFGWKLSLVVVLAAMPVLLVCQFVKLRNEWKFEQMNNQVFSESSTFATEAIAAFRTVSSLTMEETILKRYSDMLANQIKSSTQRATYATLLIAFCDSVELAAMALAFWYGGQLLASQEYEPTQFFVIYIAIIMGSISAGQFLASAPSVATATASANRILRQRTLGLTDETKMSELPENFTDTGAKVELDRVRLDYATREAPTFKNLSLTIPSGSFAAFVGPSGCGKTSVISLLERFYTPSAGMIRIDGLNIQNLPLAAYRRTISLVAQEPRLFSGSIRSNLLLGLDTTTTTTIDSPQIDDTHLHEACSAAEIHDFITSLPQGYDTELGQSTNTALSGGQKQRLCLARALLRRPKLLLLDEATSSLDSQSEKLVQGAIERLTVASGGARTMTVIAVAHRLATIQKADVIFVFGETEVGDGARIVESGSHAELLRRRGAYWQMCQAQALDQ